MPTKSVNGREFEIGVLQPETVSVHPEPKGAYYSMLMGKNPSGETRSIITRGAGKQWGATRVPIQVPVKIAVKLQRTGLTASSSYSEVVGMLAKVDLAFIKVLLVQMPREGNFASGWEWNAPGGTQELGEAPEDIANREFSEESDLVPLWTGTDFPTWMQFASGCYDEVQYLSFALVTGNPTKLVEGARQWTMVPFSSFQTWTHSQNQLQDAKRWSDDEFCPVDGKVYSLVRSLAADMSLESLWNTADR